VGYTYLMQAKQGHKGLHAMGLGSHVLAVLGMASDIQVEELLAGKDIIHLQQLAGD
jgi:hypothetical protein